MTPPDTVPELRTHRLLLRHWRFADVPDVAAYAADPEYWRYLRYWREGYGEPDAAQFIARRLLDVPRERLDWAAEYNGRAIGGINARLDVENEVVTLGYSVGRVHWGQGFISEAAAAVTDYAFETLGAAKVRATADAGNIGSWRVMEKIGMQREGHFRSHRKHGDERRDVVEYAILRAEWEPRVADHAEAPAL